LYGLFADALAKENIYIEEVLEEFGEERVAVLRDSPLRMGLRYSGLPPHTNLFAADLSRFA
jgi:hypothetical protein